MAGCMGILSVFVEWLAPLYKALLIMITMLAFGWYYRNLEAAFAREELKKEQELKKTDR